MPFAVAHYNLGCLLAQKGRVDESITHFKKALSIKPDFEEAKVNLDAALQEKKKP